jgi:hypothetical protein
MIKNFVCCFSNEGWIRGKKTSKNSAGGGKLPNSTNPRIPAIIVDFLTRKNSEMIAIDKELIGISNFSLP